MSITKEPPRRIHLGGPLTLVNDDPTAKATEAITPGHLVEMTSTGYRKHATGGGATTPAFALDAPEYNKGYADDYAADDLVWVGIGAPGTSFWAWLDSGENVARGAALESAGNGNLQAHTSGTNLAKALEAVNASSGSARIRVEVI
jgi:hypothetical protein